ncbi:flagellar motor switch protein FliM [Sporobacter termitidis DSM 10068]|uniref:Flagellar motor switch protein FliM n=1 Tax=Sporobacter termitidis DSM 10068 TaxID=1123282 RepID=A0A1M5W826_9FIRM|nr:flagellar motor switch protein FliM [Sporobacter termitidis]SHH83637.1 flagellar motor switch protein FliM [Sporobacter termitidis DSM 10068]
MLDVLSQAEIDKLLKDLATGGAEENEAEAKSVAKPYDFKTANRFTKEQIRAINVVFKNFGHLLSNYLMGTLRATCDSEVLSVEEISFNEFNNSVPSPVIIAVIDTEPFTGSIILEMTKEISYSIISRVLGGTKEISAEGRQFTEIELAIMERVLWQSLKNFDEAWSKIMETSSTLEKIDTSMQFAQIVDMNEPVLMVTLNVTIGNESGLIGFCLPHQALEPFTKKLNTRHMYSGNVNKKIDADPTNIINSIRRTDILVSAIFNPTEATVRDITSLDVGDVIQLQHKVDEPLIVKYQQLPKYRASMGKFRNSLALKILEEIKGEDDNE